MKLTCLTSITWVRSVCRQSVAIVNKFWSFKLCSTWGGIPLASLIIDEGFIITFFFISSTSCVLNISGIELNEWSVLVRAIDRIQSKWYTILAKSRSNKPVGFCGVSCHFESMGPNISSMASQIYGSSNGESISKCGGKTLNSGDSADNYRQVRRSANKHLELFP